MHETNVCKLTIVLGDECREGTVVPDVVVRVVFFFAHPNFVQPFDASSPNVTRNDDAKSGWLQMVELQYQFQSSNRRLEDGKPLRKWNGFYLEGPRRLGKDPGQKSNLPSLMKEAGFEDVEHLIVELPTCR